jgi:hypothetical protein
VVDYLRNPTCGCDCLKDEYQYVYQFKITLEESNPPIWRRIQVPESYTFKKLHAAIQDSMDWDDYHLHEFQVVKPSRGEIVSIGVPHPDYGFPIFDEPILDEAKQKIRNYFTAENPSAIYRYDFGDQWEHMVELEKILPRQEGPYPRCTGGKRACPPEDCGGVWGYMRLLETLKTPDHEEYEDMVEWVGEDFDPEYFDVSEVFFRDDV